MPLRNASRERKASVGGAMGRGAVILLLVSLSLQGCARGDNESVTPDEAKTTSEIPTAASEAPASAPEELSKGNPQRYCSRREPVVADVDGDGRKDQVFHSWVKGQALVGVCTAAGEKDSR